jgi:hypothetical protein
MTDRLHPLRHGRLVKRDWPGRLSLHVAGGWPLWTLTKRRRTVRAIVTPKVDGYELRIEYAGEVFGRMLLPDLEAVKAHAAEVKAGWLALGWSAGNSQATFDMESGGHTGSGMESRGVPETADSPANHGK